MLGRLYEWQLPLERQALAAAAELAAVQPGERLLDVATGTGALPRALAARGARPGEAVGTGLLRLDACGRRRTPTA